MQTRIPTPLASETVGTSAWTCGAMERMPGRERDLYQPMCASTAGLLHGDSCCGVQARLPESRAAARAWPGRRACERPRRAPRAARRRTCRDVDVPRREILGHRPPDRRDLPPLLVGEGRVVAVDVERRRHRRGAADLALPLCVGRHVAVKVQVDDARGVGAAGRGAAAVGVVRCTDADGLRT